MIFGLYSCTRDNPITHEDFSSFRHVDLLRRGVSPNGHTMISMLSPTYQNKFNDIHLFGFIIKDTANFEILNYDNVDFDSLFICNNVKRFFLLNNIVELHGDTLGNIYIDTKNGEKLYYLVNRKADKKIFRYIGNNWYKRK